MPLRVAYPILLAFQKHKADLSAINSIGWFGFAADFLCDFHELVIKSPKLLLITLQSFAHAAGREPRKADIPSTFDRCRLWTTPTFGYYQPMPAFLTMGQVRLAIKTVLSFENGKHVILSVILFARIGHVIRLSSSIAIRETLSPYQPFY